MAKRIKFIPINGSDTIAESRKSINQNFELIEGTLDLQSKEGISNLSVNDVTWNNGTDKGPSATIQLSTGKTSKIGNIPSASANNSGVITTGPQEMSGEKTFKEGIVTDFVTDSFDRSVIASSSNDIYIGGENGIRLTFDGKSLKHVHVPGMTDSTGDLSGLHSAINKSEEKLTQELENQLKKINSINEEYKKKLEEESKKLETISKGLGDVNSQISDLQNQTDNKVDNLFGEASEMMTYHNTWTNTNTNEEHVGDTFTDVTNKVCYVYQKSSDGTFSWVEIDSEEYPSVVQALLLAIDAKSTADGKCTTFYGGKPTIPYYMGDIWILTEDYKENGEKKYENGTMLFCNKSNVVAFDINDWSDSLIAYAKMEYVKQVESTIGDVEDALEKVKTELDYINDDDVFSIFEKKDFLNKTWYEIAGSYVFNSEDTEHFDEDGMPTEGIYGTTTKGTIWNAISSCSSEQKEDVNELLSSFNTLGLVCKKYGIFTTPFETTTEFTEEKKNELFDALFNYYREEEECRKNGYISSVGDILTILEKQIKDGMVQTWYGDGNPPTTKETLPWVLKGDNDIEAHIGDTFNSMDTNSLYRFTSTGDDTFNSTENGDIACDDITIGELGNLHTCFWKKIKKDDTQSIIDEIRSEIPDYNEVLAKIDGSVNIFHTTPTGYSYGDIWFCSNDATYGSGDNTKKFISGDIYYCSNTELDGKETNGENGENIRNVANTFNPSDWSEATQTSNFITRFANMAADNVLTPIEKNQLLIKWYEIVGIDLNSFKPDEDLDGNGTEGSFFTVKIPCSEIITELNGESKDSSEYSTLVSNLKSKVIDIYKVLCQCGCLTREATPNKSEDTDLTTITISGLSSFSSSYNGKLASEYAGMLSDIFTTYYLEEDNIKLSNQLYTVNTLKAELETKIEAAQTAANNAQAAIDAIDSDDVFSVIEKRAFLNNTWYPIAGSFGYDSEKELSYYKGTSVKGSFHDVLLTLGDNSETDANEVFVAFKALGDICNSFGLFDETLTATNNFSDENRTSIYNAVYEYYREEEECRKNGYIDSLGNVLDSLQGQLDGMIKSWYKVSVPTSQDQMPWRYSDENDSEKSSNDLLHVGDILTITGGNLEGSIFEFTKVEEGTTSNDDNGDVACVGNISGYFWRHIQHNDIQSLIDQVKTEFPDFDEILAKADGGINVFSGQEYQNGPTTYSYGDIWFCIKDLEYTYTDGGEKKINFLNGGMYVCDNRELTGVDTEHIRIVFDGRDWKGATDNFITQFANMASDKVLTPVEKSEMIREWYAISGVSLENFISADNILTIASNTGSFYSTTKSCIPFIANENDTYDIAVKRIKNKLRDIYTILSLCGCKGDDKRNNTELENVTVSGLLVSSDYNTKKASEHTTMISDIFATYYMEEDNIKVLVNDYNLTQVSNQMTQDIKDLRKSVETASTAMDSAIEKLNEFNDDNVFSVREKKDFLYNTWYKIAGSGCKFDSKETKFIDGSIYGANSSGSFIQVLSSIDFQSPEATALIAEFKDLGKFCDDYGLFADEKDLKSSNVDNFKRVLCEQLYDYYNQEEICKQLQYIGSVSNVVDDLAKNIKDGIVQSWFGEGNPAQMTNDLPWSDEFENHEGDTYTNTNNRVDSTGKTIDSNGGNVYKFVSTKGATIKETSGDFKVKKSDTGAYIGYYWKLIQSSDITTIMNKISSMNSDFNSQLATIDGGINVFNNKPTKYSYGDIWFCNTSDEVYGSDNKRTIVGDVYYCSNESLDGLINSTTKVRNVRDVYTPSDWSNGTKAEDFITQFANMASDSVLTPIEKGQLLSKWFEISGIQLAQELDTDALLKSDANNIGTFHIIGSEFSKIASKVKESDEINGNSILERFTKKFKDIWNLLLSVECLNKDKDTDLSEVSITGLEYSIGYNGQALTTNLIPSIFSIYYSEEENLKTLIQRYRIEEESVKLTNEIGVAKDAAEEAKNMLSHINDDNVFSVFEKRDFLNSVWYKIAGVGRGFNSTLKNTSGEIGDNFYGCSSDGSFWQTVKGKQLSELRDIIEKYGNLGTKCYNLGLFETTLTDTTQFDRSDLYSSLYAYYNEEEKTKQSNYVNSVESKITQLKEQLKDGKLQSWYGNGNPPTDLAQMPWVLKGDTNNDAHVGDTWTNTSSAIGDDADPNAGKVYQFVKVVTNSIEPSTDDDFSIGDGTLYFWDFVKSDDTIAILEKISDLKDSIDNVITDGSITIFNNPIINGDEFPTEYTFGDMWFVSSDVTHGSYEFFEGNIYYCSNRNLDGTSDTKISHGFIPTDWEIGSKSGQLAVNISNMASDDFLSPVEKNDLLGRWNEITDLSLDNFDEDKFTKDGIDGSNRGTFYKTIKDYGEDDEELSKTLLDLSELLKLCGCSTNDKQEDTKISDISIGGDYFKSKSNEDYNEETLSGSIISHVFNSYYNREEEIRVETRNAAINTANNSLKTTLEVKIAEAKQAAADAQEKANEAADNANQTTINLSDIVSDGKITPFEKQLIIDSFESIFGSKLGDKTSLLLSNTIFNINDENDENDENNNRTKLKEYFGGDNYKLDVEFYPLKKGSYVKLISNILYNHTMYFAELLGIDENQVNRYEQFKNLNGIKNKPEEFEQESFEIICNYIINGDYTSGNGKGLLLKLTHILNDICIKCNTIGLYNNTTYAESSGNFTENDIKSLFTEYSQTEVEIWNGLSVFLSNNAYNEAIHSMQGNITATEIEGLAKDSSGSAGLTLTSLIKTKWNNAETGGLDGVTTIKNSSGRDVYNAVGLWLGGTHQEAINTLTGTIQQGQSTVPVVLTKFGIGSKIGPLKIRNANTISIDNDTYTTPTSLTDKNKFNTGTGKSTVISSEYISMGATYAESSMLGDDKSGAIKNSIVLLKKEGVGSRIGPFNVGAKDHIYIGDSNSGNVTVMGTDYISMGTTYANSDTKDDAKSNAIVYLDRNGVGSKIGPFNVGAKDHIYISNSNSDNVTVIGTDYISMGTTYANSDTKDDAKSNAIVYLDNNGVGSKIGPLKLALSNKFEFSSTRTGYYVSVNSDILNQSQNDGLVRFGCLAVDLSNLTNDTCKLTTTSSNSSKVKKMVSTDATVGSIECGYRTDVAFMIYKPTPTISINNSTKTVSYSTVCMFGGFGLNIVGKTYSVGKRTFTVNDNNEFICLLDNSNDIGFLIPHITVTSTTRYTTFPTRTTTNVGTLVFGDVTQTGHELSNNTVKGFEFVKPIFVVTDNGSTRTIKMYVPLYKWNDEIIYSNDTYNFKTSYSTYSWNYNISSMDAPSFEMFDGDIKSSTKSNISIGNNGIKVNNGLYYRVDDCNNVDFNVGNIKTDILLPISNKNGTTYSTINLDEKSIPQNSVINGTVFTTLLSEILLRISNSMSNEDLKNDVKSFIGKIEDYSILLIKK